MIKISRKLKQFAVGIVLSTVILSSLGCGNNSQSSSSATTEDIITTEEDVEIDSMDIGSEDNKEFYMLRVEDMYYEVQSNQLYLEPVYCETGGCYPEIEDGQVEKVVADVNIYNGGEDGFSNTLFIKKIKSFEAIDYDTFFKLFDIKDAAGTPVKSANRFLKYQNMNDHYLLVPEGHKVRIYKEGEYQISFDTDLIDAGEDYPKLFFNWLEEQQNTDISSETDAETETLSESTNESTNESSGNEVGVLVDGYHQITATEAMKMMEEEEDYIILDVRTDEEYYEGHIEGAMLLTNSFIGEEPIPELPDKDQLIFVYCRSGRRSKDASRKLALLGYTNVYEFGGVIDWPGALVQD